MGELLYVQGRGEMTFMPAVTLAHLHQFDVDTGTGCKGFITGYRLYYVSACSN